MSARNAMFARKIMFDTKAMSEGMAMLDTKATSEKKAMSERKIVVDGLVKSFMSNKGALSVIDDVSFSVDDGEFVAIVGPSGCGKSTLMNIIAGFERQDRGWVNVDGVE